MSILDEREPAPSLKLIVIAVSLITFGAFGALFLVNGAQASAHQHQVPAEATPAT